MVCEFSDLTFMASSQELSDMGWRSGVVEVESEELVGIVGSRLDVCRGRRDEAQA
jgi:hypothetical protein